MRLRDRQATGQIKHSKSAVSTLGRLSSSCAFIEKNFIERKYGSQGGGQPFLDSIKRTYCRNAQQDGRDRDEVDMAMTMKGEVLLPADRNTVWTKLNDPEVLKACIPGCQTLEASGENGFSAVVKVKVGPVSARFKGSVELLDLDPPNGYRISGQGEGGIACFVKGGAKITLTDAENGGTLLSYDVAANVGGKMAQLGARLMNGVAKNNTDQFFNTFAKITSGD